MPDASSTSLALPHDRTKTDFRKRLEYSVRKREQQVRNIQQRGSESCEPSPNQSPSSERLGKVQPGTRYGNFLISGELGRGGLAIVYHAFDNRQESQEVALKVMRNGLIVGDGFSNKLKEATEGVKGYVDYEKKLKLNSFELFKNTFYLRRARGELRELVQDLNEELHRFDREVEVLHRLEHPNIVQIVSDGTIYHDPGLIPVWQEFLQACGSFPHEQVNPILEQSVYDILHRELGEHLAFPTRYLGMNVVEGDSLKRKIQHSGLLHPHKVRAIAKDVLEVLHYMHKQGYIHRDLKPSNILLEERTGRAILADFGLAKHVDRDSSSQTFQTPDGQGLGTLLYLPPEVALGHPHEYSADLYSLGITLFELLTGKQPFKNATSTSIEQSLAYIVNTQFPRLQGESVLIEIINNMTQPEKSKRSEAKKLLQQLS